MSKATKFSIRINPFLHGFSDWSVAMTDDDDPLFSFSLAPVVPSEDGGIRVGTMHHDVFLVRDSFFAIRGDAANALKFFETFGPWRVEKKFANSAEPVSLSAVVAQVAFYEEALLADSTDDVYRRYNFAQMADFLKDFTLRQPLEMELLFTQPLSGRIVCKDVEHAVLVSVFLERLDGLPLRRCAREGCEAVFKLTSKHDKRYCTVACAHLQSVRDYNDRKKKAQRKRKQATQQKLKEKSDPPRKRNQPKGRRLKHGSL